MKIIHCADLHLDSKLTANLNPAQAKERKAELLHTFIRMIDYAVEQNVQAILMAGDLFDRNQITQTARNTVLQQILNHPELDIYYLQGNHDVDSFLSHMEELPENLHIFSDTWKQYVIENGYEKRIVISGVELDAGNQDSIYPTLMLNADDFNIVMLHGQESEQSGKDKTEIISLRDLRNKGIDYLALGHIHKYKQERLDSRGIYCYPGCLEGRGFDECGEHGFVLLDINEQNGEFTHTFIPFAYRRLYEVPVDITGCQTSEDIMQRLNTTLQQQDIASRNLVKLVLTGEVDVTCEKDTELLRKQLEDKYYYLKLYDESGWKVDVQSYAKDVSLKGEFIRLVSNAEELSEADKAAVIRYGIQALAGEEIQ